MEGRYGISAELDSYRRGSVSPFAVGGDPWEQFEEATPMAPLRTIEITPEIRAADEAARAAREAADPLKVWSIRETLSKENLRGLKKPVKVVKKCSECLAILDRRIRGAVCAGCIKKVKQKNHLGTLRSIGALGGGRPHGDRLRYLAGCKCAECRRANTQYEIGRAKLRKAGLSNGIVSAKAARKHILRLSKMGIGRDAIAKACGCGVTVITEVRRGTKEQIRQETERRILSVTTKAALGGSYTDAAPTWKKLDKLLALGMTKTAIARRLTGGIAIQIRRTSVTVSNAAKVDALYRELTSRGRG